MSFPSETSVNASANLRAVCGPKRATPLAAKSRILVSREMETLADIAAIIAQENLCAFREIAPPNARIQLHQLKSRRWMKRCEDEQDDFEFLVRRHTRRGAKLLKSALQFLSNLFGSFAFDLIALHHVNELAISQKSDRGRRRQITSKVAARSFGRLDISSREH